MRGRVQAGQVCAPSPAPRSFRRRSQNAGMELCGYYQVMEGVLTPPHLNGASLMGYTTVTNGSSYSIQAHPSDFPAALDIYHWASGVGAGLSCDGGTSKLVRSTTDGFICPVPPTSDSWRKPHPGPSAGAVPSTTTRDASKERPPVFLGALLGNTAASHPFLMHQDSQK